MPKAADKQVFGAILSRGGDDLSAEEDLETWLAAELSSALAKGDPAIRDRLEAIADLSGNERAIAVALARTRRRLEDELRKLTEDPVVKAANVVARRKRPKKKLRKRGEDHVYEMLPRHEYVHRKRSAADPHNLSSLLLQRTPRTRLEMLPVLAKSGEAAFEVGLKSMNPLLPVFKLPRVSENASFVQRLPKEDTAAESKVKQREKQELEYMKEALNLSSEELEELEDDLRHELRSGDPESDVALPSPETAEAAKTTTATFMKPVDVPSSPVPSEELAAEQTRRPSTPRVLREKKAYDVDKLRSDLGRSISSMCNFSTALKADVLAIRELCPIPKNHPAQQFFKRWGAERLCIALESIVISLVRATWLRWRENVRRIKRAERLAQYKTYQSSRRLHALLVDAFRSKLARGWVRWVAFLRMERAQEIATMRHAAARRVQAAWRIKLAKKNLKRLRLVAIEQLRKEAAMKIQGFARGAATRKLFTAIMREKRRDAAAQLLQRVGLGMLGRRRARDECRRQLETASSVKVQARVRGWLARRSFAVVLEQHRRQKAALLIQRAARGKEGRRELARRRFAYRQAIEATRVQTRIRMVLAKRRVRRLLLERQERFIVESKAALLIQRVHRGRQGRVEHKIKLYMRLAERREKDQGAVKIQSAVRAFVARQKVGRLRAGRRERWFDDARQVKEAWDENASCWYYYNDATGESTLEPPPTGYTKLDGRLVLANGEVLDDPYADMSVKEAREAQKEKVADLQECIECENRIATRWCAICDDPFCDSCWATIHAHGKRQAHAFANIHDDGSVSPRLTTLDGDDAGAFQGIVPGTTAAALVNIIKEESHPSNSSWGGTGTYSGTYSSNDADGSYQSPALIEADPGQEWFQYADDDGYPFWYNANTGVSHYEDPFSSTGEGTFDPNQETASAQYPAGASPSVYDPSIYAGSVSADGSSPAYTDQGAWQAGNWEQYEDDDGIPYFYNPITGVSQYEDPNETYYAGAE